MSTFALARPLPFSFSPLLPMVATRRIAAMRLSVWIGTTLLLLSGCGSTAQERAQVLNEGGVRLFQSGNYPAAQEQFRAALQLTPGDGGLLYNIGQCYERQGDWTRAEQTYQECLRQSPNHPACRHALTVHLVQEGRQSEAIRLVEDWLAREPRLAAPYAEDGWLWRQAGDLPRAQARLHQGLELDPHNVLALTEMAEVYEALGRPERAVVLYERVLTVDPNQGEAKNRLQVLLAKGAGRPRPD
jgi:Tfp pilus assembly protein PilF